MKDFLKFVVIQLIFISISYNASQKVLAQDIEELNQSEKSITKEPKTFLHLSLFAKIAEIENTMEVNAVLFSMLDSINVNLLVFETPSFVKPILNSEFEPYYLMTGLTENHIFTFSITKNESFKLKGIVYGNYNDEKTKLHTIKNLFFFWDDGHYLISDDITQLIGRKRKNGDVIELEDMKIFTNAEIE